MNLESIDGRAYSDDELDNFDDKQLDATSAVGTDPDVVPEANDDSSATDEKATAVAPGADTESGEDSEKTPKKNLIARHRYNYQKQQREMAEQRARELAERLAEMEQKIAQAQAAQPSGISYAEAETKLSELDQAIEDARADGDTRKVAQLRAEQRHLERLMITASVQPAQKTVDERQIIQKATESLRLEAMVEQLEKQYPMLEEGNEAFDNDLSDEVMSLYDTLLRRMPPAQAMERAVLYVTSAHGIDPETVKPAKRTTNVARNVAAAQAQPPDLKGVGYDGAKAGVQKTVDVMHMSQDDFERLSEKEIEKLLRGAT